MGLPGHQRQNSAIGRDSIDTMRGRASNRPNVQPPSDLPGVQDPLRRPQRGLSGRGAENRPSVIGPEGQKMPTRRTSGMIPESLRMSDVGGDPSQAAASQGNQTESQRSRLSQMVGNTFDSMVGNPEAANAFASMLARLGGESGGRLTDQDIKRAMSLIPTPNDDANVVLQKKQALLGLIEQGSSGMFGQQSQMMGGGNPVTSPDEMNQIRQMMEQIGNQPASNSQAGREIPGQPPQRRGPAGPVGYANPRTR